MAEHQIQFLSHVNEKLFGTLHRPVKPSGMGIVIGHCFTCSRHTRVLQQIARDLDAAQATVLRFDFSGNGQSEGDFLDASYSKHIAEMKTAVSYLSQNGASWIGLAGHSMGAIIALLTAAQMKSARSVCVLAGRISGMRASQFLDKAQREEIRQSGRVAFTSRGRSLQISKDFFADADRYDLPGLVKAFKSKILVIHGDRDEIVPLEEAYQAQRLNPKAVTLDIVPGADHMFSSGNHRRHVAAKVTDWFAGQFAKDGASP